MSIELSNECVVTVVLNAVTAGTTLQTSSVLDMQGFDGVMYIACLGTVTSGAVITLTAYENPTNSTSTPTAVTSGASTAYTAGGSSSNTQIIVDVVRPSMRYHFCELARTTDNVVINCILAIQYRARNIPTTQPAAVVEQQLGGFEV